MRPLERVAVFGTTLIGLTLMVVGFVGGLSDGAIAMLGGGSVLVGIVGLWLIAGAVPLTVFFWQAARQRVATGLVVVGMLVAVVGIGTSVDGGITSLALVGFAGIVAGVALLTVWSPVPPTGYQWGRGEDGGPKLVPSPKAAEVRGLFEDAAAGGRPRPRRGDDAA